MTNMDQLGDGFNHPPVKLTWQWKIIISSRRYIFKGSIYHCYVSLPESMFHFYPDPWRDDPIYITCPSFFQQHQQHQHFLLLVLYPDILRSVT